MNPTHFESISVTWTNISSFEDLFKRDKLFSFHQGKIQSLAIELFKGALSGLRQFLAAETPLKMMKNAFYFTSKALFVLKIFKFLS